ncbi:MAG: glycosyltransferase family 2 protein [Methylacidiphilales bacterium]|nr:glycosyltransferase family 2 protein [Candidatus Methylacidiphilales bacterium]
MNQNKNTFIIPSHWEVPPSLSTMYFEKRKNIIVLVPVFNEGERIISLISKMAENKIHEYADICIVDAGSTDSSLDHEHHIKNSIRGVVTRAKGVSGRLGSDLRIGFAFGLSEGYDYFITIDGNNKDDPRSIINFVSALKNGDAQYIQASRFITGGIAINTPVTRKIAIKFIHSPLLSLFSGFRWTDTTQGFRGYTSKLLSDERLGLFRNCFVSYEILSYLTYRVPQLGYACLELPSTRSYPKGEVPTKISFIRGNGRVLLILFLTCLGYYNIK